MSDHGHYGKRRKGESRQGIYVFTAEGKFLSSINTLSADRVLKTIEEGLAKWDALPESERKPAATTTATVKPKHRWEAFYPRDGLVLKIFNRDLSPALSPSEKQLPTWNRDAAWFSPDELKQIVPENLKVGQSFEFHDLFVSRLCRMHFVDSVKGQTEAFDDSEIEGSRISASVVKREGDVLSLEINGKTRGKREQGRYKFGVETELIGSAEYDESKKKFTKLEFVALGHRWGQTRFNGRRRQLERSPIGFTFEIADPKAQPIVPGIIWEYDGLPWLKQPSE